jgi:hypothetical protein
MAPVFWNLALDIRLVILQEFFTGIWYSFVIKGVFYGLR